MKNELIETIKSVDKDVEKLMNDADIIIGNTIRKVNYETILMYWRLGKVVLEYKEENNSRYGDQVVQQFSIELQMKYGSGFGVNDVRSSMNFYKFFKKKPSTVLFETITWTHCKEIISTKDKTQIKFYLDEVNNKKLTVVEFREYIKSNGFERTISNQKKGLIKNEIERTQKDPMILGIKNKRRSEKELEDEIVKNILNFMREIGNDVMFRGRQYKLFINNLLHKIDLVFFDYETNTFILVDLKVSKVTNHDIMQMKLYVEYFGKEKNNANVVGLILTETKDPRLIDNNNVYQIKYLNEIPKNKELEKLIYENKIILLKTDSLRL